MSNTLINNNTNLITYQTLSHIKWPTILNMGLYGNIGLLHKLYKGLYLGVGLGVGIANEFRFGKGINSYKEYTNGVLTKNEYREELYTTYFDGNMDMRPTIKLQYNF